MAKGNVEPLIELDSVSKTFFLNDGILIRLDPRKSIKGVSAVNDVNLKIHQGDIQGLVGESGSGKSTVAKLILGLYKPTQGNVYFQGKSVSKFNATEMKDYRCNVQFIFQDPYSSLNPRYKIKRTLTEPMKIHDLYDDKEERYDNAVELMKQVGLGEEHLNRYPHEFSGGQRQRINIARALSLKPKVIIADEPVSALDVSVQASILDLLDDLINMHDLTVLLISHDLGVVRYVCDQVNVMYLGEIVEKAPRRLIFEKPKHPYTQSLISSIPIPSPGEGLERIELKGEIPSPVNPPSGCKFHPRCPYIIPPNPNIGQDAWLKLFHLKQKILSNNLLEFEERQKLRQDDHDNLDQFCQDIYYNNISKTSFSIPKEVEEDFITAIHASLADNRTKAETILNQYTSKCQDTKPKTIEGSWTVKCHLYDDTEEGTPDIADFSLKISQNSHS